jgi:hypothetical protein
VAVCLTSAARLLIVPIVPMSIVKATQKYEAWLSRHMRVVASDLQRKHEEMAKKPFPFLRATFYRWLQLWPEVCPELSRAPRVLGVGDLHVENFGTWRDTDGRLVWGINDFDEARPYPYTMDLVRLATSAMLATREKNLSMRPKDAVARILKGYTAGMRKGGRPFVLAEDHGWLRTIAESKLRDPVEFWRKMDALPTLRGEPPEGVREAIEAVLPRRGLKYRLARRFAGLGGRGHPRFVAITDYAGGKLAREAKSLGPASIFWLTPERAPEASQYARILKNAVRCPDPYVRLHGAWIVRRLSPHCSRIELTFLAANRGELRLLEAMGWETANIHLGSERQRDAILEHLRGRKPGWLYQAAEGMARVVEKDWRVWKAHS